MQLNETTKKRAKAIRKNLPATLKIVAILILLAGVYVFGLPELTLDEATGSLSLLTLTVVLIKWVN